MFAKATQFHWDVSTVEDYLNLSVEADLCYCQGYASQIGRVLFEGHPKYSGKHGRRTSDRKVRRRRGRASNHATCCASRTSAESVHHSRCLHTGHNNGVLHYLDSVFRSQRQTEGVEIRRGDAADRSNQRASQVQRGDLQKRHEQERATKVGRLRREKILRESCVLVQGRSGVRPTTENNRILRLDFRWSPLHDTTRNFFEKYFFFLFNCELPETRSVVIQTTRRFLSWMVFIFYV